MSGQSMNDLAERLTLTLLDLGLKQALILLLACVTASTQY